MSLPERLELENFFYFFEKICEIPHGSGNVGRISDFLADFARQRELSYIQDEWKNIIIFKDAYEGYGGEPPVIIQGHMDMVAVKKPESEIDMINDPLQLRTEGDWIYAENTSLGGDDGIALAYGLALLDAEDIPHPKLEVIFTVDEETGMDGARNLDVSMLHGKRMLNLDSEEEGILLAGCAGGARVDVKMPVDREQMQGIGLRIWIKGLAGGHSGTEIHKDRGNAIQLMGRLLHRLKSTGASLTQIQGGLADNAIPREVSAVVVVPAEGEAAVLEEAVKMQGILQNELQTKDPLVVVEIEHLGEMSCACLTEKKMEDLTGLLCCAPCGVMGMSADIAGLVETSVNPGVIVSEAEKITLRFSIRSSIESAKSSVIDQIALLAKWSGAESTVRGEYPGWAFLKNSPFRDKAIRIYSEMYGKKPLVQAIHAGLECGLLSAKIEGLECVSLGPDMENIHTTEERLSISSTERVWQYILALLRDKQ